MILTICHLFYLLEVEESRLLGFPSSIPLSWLVGLEVLEVRSKSSSIMEEVVMGGELSSIITLSVGGLGASLFFRDIFFFVNFFSSLCKTESWSPWFSWKKERSWIQSRKTLESLFCETKQDWKCKLEDWKKSRSKNTFETSKGGGKGAFRFFLGIMLLRLMTHVN